METLLALAALLCAPTFASALLNCSRWRPAAFTSTPPTSHFQTNQPNDTASPSIPSEQTASEGSTTRRLFLEPLLHACMQAHPYDTSQLPLLAGAPFAPLRLQYSFMLHRVVRVEPEEQVVLTASIELEWRDSTRAWAERHVGAETSAGGAANGWLEDVRSVRVPIGELWRPTWALVNSELDDLLLVPDNQPLVEVRADGNVSLTISRRFMAHCKLDVERFPYDTQLCTLLFHLFYYSGEHLELEPAPLVSSVYEMSNGEWELLRLADEPRLFSASVYAREPDGGRGRTPVKSYGPIAQGFAVNHWQLVLLLIE